jgi:hypothetical protein
MSIHQYSKHLSKDIPDYKSKLCNNVEHDAIYKVDFDEILTTSDILTMEINGVNMCFSKEDVKEMLKNNMNYLTNEKLGEFEKSVMNLFLSSLYYYNLFLDFVYDELNIIFEKIEVGNGYSDFIFQSLLYSKTTTDYIENRKNMDNLIEFVKNNSNQDSKFKFYGIFTDSNKNDYKGVCIIEYKKYKSPIITIYYDKNINSYKIYKAVDYRQYEKFSETFINKIDTKEIETDIEIFSTRNLKSEKY